MSNSETKKKILIIRLSSMGDVIFNIPLANNLKDNGYEVSWLAGEKGYTLIKDNPCVDKVFFAPVEKWKKSKNIIKNLKEWYEIIIKLRKEHYDIALDTQMLMKSIPFTMFCGAKRRLIAKDAREFSQIGANEIIPKITDKFNIPIVKSYLKFAQYLGYDTSNIKVTLPETSPEDENYINELIKNIDPNKKTVVIAPATTWVAKHWDKNNWKNLVEKLENKYNIIFTGGEKDNELINYINKNNPHLNLAGKTSLLQLVALLRKSDLLLSLDSGTTHLGWATQVPKVISIFCCTPKSLYAPIGDSEKYVALSGNLPCQPCHHRKCKLKEKNLCTQNPSVEEILQQIEKFML